MVLMYLKVVGLQAVRHCNSTNHELQLPTAYHTHPALQVPKAGWPFAQAGAALAKGVAGVLHAPQLAVLVMTLISQPLLAIPSQSLYLQGQEKDTMVHAYPVSA
jgi:hypothetical protein